MAVSARGAYSGEVDVTGRGEAGAETLPGEARGVAKYDGDGRGDAVVSLVRAETAGGEEGEEVKAAANASLSTLRREPLFCLRVERASGLAGEDGGVPGDPREGAAGRLLVVVLVVAESLSSVALGPGGETDEEPAVLPFSPSSNPAIGWPFIVIVPGKSVAAVAAAAMDNSLPIRAPCCVADCEASALPPRNA